ncbi:hypothetical protein chiPu_0024107, partial [Chiloscyllium punctatum]|nr:hypothetical protein [Chiloscyllium punctatum]
MDFRWEVPAKRRARWHVTNRRAWRAATTTTRARTPSCCG